MRLYMLYALLLGIATSLMVGISAVIARSSESSSCSAWSSPMLACF